MFDQSYDLETVLNWSEQDFTEKYEDTSTQAFLDYMENRIRFELIELINSLDRKGEIFLEVRKKGTLSAFNKLLKSAKKQAAGGKITLLELVQDFIGCRLICFDDEVLISTFKALLQSEQFAIAEGGFELYSAPFRVYENKSSRYKRVVDKLKLDKNPTDQIKATNYESLHCYISFTQQGKFSTNKIDYLLRGIETQRQGRYKAEAQRIAELYDEMGPTFQSLTTKFLIECQVRTMLEHMWASEEHKYVYEKTKGDSGVLNDPTIKLLKDVFTALKYQYNALEDMRDIVKNVSRNFDEMNKPVYSGTSKDISSIRTKYFDDYPDALLMIKESASQYTTIQEQGKRETKGRQKKAPEIEQVFRKLTDALKLI